MLRVADAPPRWKTVFLRPLDIGASEISTLEQQREVPPPDKRVSENIAQIEAREMTPLAVA